jgi:chaperonin GroES
MATENHEVIHVPLPAAGLHNLEDAALKADSIASENMSANAAADLPISLKRIPGAPVVVDRRRAYDDSPRKPFTAQPIGDYLVVRRIVEPDGLIIEADIAQDKPVNCEVVAVSQHASTLMAEEALQTLAPGDKVLIRRYAGTEVKLDGEEFTLVLIFDVLLKLDVFGEKAP